MCFTQTGLQRIMAFLTKKIPKACSIKQISIMGIYFVLN